MSNSNRTLITNVKAALSPARMATYEAAVGGGGVLADDDLSALQLYAWNAEVSGALLAPLHLCEVVIRNAVAETLEAIYGNQWPWSVAFERSLPNLQRGYNPRQDLQNARKNATTTGKVIPELKFVFWQKMFTGRFDQRLWIPHLLHIFPNLPAQKTIPQHRKGIYNDLDQLRSLRNRIAHHEPIFSRNLQNDYQKIVELVSYRCASTANWLDQKHTALHVIQARP